jgi:hypothetical protein
MAAPSKSNPLSGGSLTITDDKRKAYPEAWIGMADDVEGTSQWLRVGGISDGRTSRLALAARRTSIQGSLGVNCLPTDQALEVKGGAHVTGSLSVDRELTAGSVVGGVVRATGLALSTSLGGAFTSLSANAFHAGAGWQFLDMTRPAATLDFDFTAGGRLSISTATAPPNAWQRRLSIDVETGTVEVDRHLKAGSLQVGGDATVGGGVTVDRRLKAGSLEVGGDATVSGALLNALGHPYVSATEVINHTGALPVEGSFNTSGRLAILMASGSGYSGTEGKTIGMIILIDGELWGQAKTFTNESSSHKTFAATHVLTGLPAGDHVLKLMTLAGTTTDKNDVFSVSIIAF